jgi:hypothetical protein
MPPKSPENGQRISPIFSHFLTPRMFALLYGLAVLALISGPVGHYFGGSFHSLTSDLVGLAIGIFLAPTTYYFAVTVYSTYGKLFKPSSQKLLNLPNDASEDDEVSYLFSTNSDAEQYKMSVSKEIVGRNEIFFVAGGSIICFILSHSAEFFDGTLRSIFSHPLYSWAVVGYLIDVAVWTFEAAIILSFIWFVIAILRAVLRLNEVRQHLQVTESISKLKKSIRLPEQSKLEIARIGLLDLSFRRFKAGLSPITNFVVSISVKVAFFGVFVSVPPLIFFVTTQQVSAYWYGLAVSICVFSVAIFVIGHYGVWRIWSTAKKDAHKVIDSVCKGRTDTCSDILSAAVNKSDLEIKEMEKEVAAIRRISDDINSLDTSTYKASSVFKLLSVNFLAFAPILLERLIATFVLK